MVGDRLILVAVAEFTLAISTPRLVVRQWKLVLLGMLVLAFTMIGGVSPAAAAESITSPHTLGSAGTHSSVELDAGGNPVISYYDITNADLRLLHCNDPKCTGGDESSTSPDTSGNVGNFTSLALDGFGNPVVSYKDDTWNDVKVLHCNDANCAGGDESITSLDTALNAGNFTSLALDASGYPVVSYRSHTFDDLKILHCNDANCTGGDESITPAGTLGDGGYFTSLALDSAGNPVVSYYDGFVLNVLHCDDANCTGGNESITLPDTSGDVGSYTSLALDGAGNPMVSYLDSTNGDLKVLHCNDANCAGGNESITSPDTSGGFYTSLAADGAGNPVVAYSTSLTNADLKVLHCNDANCAGGGESITSQDTSGASYTSLALDGFGNPVVSYAYFNGPDSDLKVLRCNDQDCAASAKVGGMTELAGVSARTARGPASRSSAPFLIAVVIGGVLSLAGLFAYAQSRAGR